MCATVLACVRAWVCECALVCVCTHSHLSEPAMLVLMCPFLNMRTYACVSQMLCS